MVKRRCRQVCLFGTSANPPTGEGGHQGIVRALSRQDDRFDEIRVLPVYRHTFPNKRHSLVSYEHRLNMCRLAFDSIPKVVVSNAEEESFHRLIRKDMTREEIQSLRVGTADLLEMLMEQEPDTEFFFCLGSDTFLDLTAWKWKRSKDVLQLLNGRLVVFFRRGMEGNGLRKRIQSVNETDGKGNIELLEVSSLRDVSSTLVRSTADERELSTLVSPEVLAYMKEHQLYAFRKKAEIEEDY